MLDNKSIKVFITLLFSATLILPGCNKAPKHKHTFESAWSSDDTYHWHAATCKHTEKVKDKAEHSFGEWIVDDDATYTQTGLKHRICSVCEYRDDEVIQIIPHDHVAGTPVNENIVIADCIHEGSHDEVTYCTLCQEELSRTNVVDGPALGHNYAVTATVSPTFEADGYKTYTCSRCGDHYDEKYGDKLEHTYSNEWTYNDSTHWHACVDDGYRNLKGDEAPHVFNERSLATKKRKCECGYTYGRYYEMNIALHQLEVGEIYDKRGPLYSFTKSGDEQILDFGFVVYFIGNEVVNPNKGDNYEIPEELLGEEVTAQVYIVVLDESKVFFDDGKIDADVLYNDEVYKCKGTMTSSWYDGVSRTCYHYEIPLGTVVEGIDKGPAPILSQDGKTVTYGIYPKTVVDNADLITALDALTEPEANGWYKYNEEYYAKAKATPFYINSTTFSNGQQVVKNNEYWFKCEPIVWRVLSNDNGLCYLLSEYILDSSVYYVLSESHKVDGVTIYSNNYKYSTIREYLTGEFYANAFIQGNYYVQETTVDNSAATTKSNSNSFACENTLDYVFLPSYKDMMNVNYGFVNNTNGSSTRYSVTTDYARARMTYASDENAYLGNGQYWLRSPNTSSYKAECVASNGGYTSGTQTDITYCGVRPAIMLKLA